jgi:hypothetical protein
MTLRARKPKSSLRFICLGLTSSTPFLVSAQYHNYNVSSGSDCILQEPVSGNWYHLGMFLDPFAVTV